VTHVKKISREWVDAVTFLWLDKKVQSRYIAVESLQPKSRLAAVSGFPRVLISPKLEEVAVKNRLVRLIVETSFDSRFDPVPVPFYRRL
jgi:hypothetical protein